MTVAHLAVTQKVEQKNMCLKPLPNSIITPLLERAFNEDLGTAGDLTSQYFLDSDSTLENKTVYMRARQNGIIAGIDIAKRAFQFYDESIQFDGAIYDGVDVKKGDLIATITGDPRSLLTAERTALNLICHLSGIATKTKNMVNLIAPYKAKLVDTRKTLPGLRAIQKYAVRAGGGYNHRFGLDDAVMIKDNHIALAGGLTKAITNCKNAVGHTVKIEVEIDRLDQIEEAIQAGADILLLDNMTPETLKKALKIINGRCISEASGNVKEDTIIAIAATGVDVISCGALTHSAINFDIGLDDA